MQKLFLGFSILFSVLFVNQSFSQSLSDIQNLNVDELTSEQIGSLIKQLEASGMDESQLVDLARANGMTGDDISKLRDRIKDHQSGTQKDGALKTTSRLRTDPISVEVIDPFAEGLITEQSTVLDATDSSNLFDNGLEIFGLKFFRNSELTFEPNLNIPSPINYILGPGDQLYVDIWGDSERVYQLTISPEGSVSIQNIGPIFVSGLTIEKAKSKIISKLKRIHSSIGNGTYADVTLGQIRTITVHVIGDVQTPGTFVLSSFSTAFNALYNAGGPSKNGSLRQIDVFRNKELISSFDAYEFLIRGTGDNVTLTDQDVIIVRPYINRVRLNGKVKNPAVYELKEGETLSDLLYYSGGFKKDAYRGTINVKRNDGNFRTIKSINQNQYDSFALENGDEMFIKEISNEYRSRVTLEGPVRNAGDYELTVGLTLSELIKKADGFRGDIFMDRGVILRQNQDYSLASLTFDPKKILSEETNILLENNDIIRFQSIYDMREEYNIRIEGEVLIPGKYEYVQDLNVENLIYMAGGFKESAARSFVEVARRNNLDSATDIHKAAEIFKFDISDDLSITEKASQFKLQPFDVVMVRKSPYFHNQELVEIEGEAIFPGTYAMERKNERISSLLKRAGGLTPYAYPKGATLIRRTEYYKVVEFGETSVHVDDDAAEMRRQDLTNRFKKEGLTENDSIDLFRQQESLGINLEQILKNPGSKYDLILREGDILSIPRELQTVRVRGEVLYPSNIQHDRSVGFKHYISRAGGFDQLAKKSKSYIIYANGSAAQTKSFMGIKIYPKVEPGAEIVVPLKPARTPMTPQAWVAFATSIGTLALLIQNITSK